MERVRGQDIKSVTKTDDKEIKIDRGRKRENTCENTQDKDNKDRQTDRKTARKQMRPQESRGDRKKGQERER